jgi:hypothetical protein
MEVCVLRLIGEAGTGRVGVFLTTDFADEGRVVRRFDPGGDPCSRWSDFEGGSEALPYWPEAHFTALVRRVW